MVDEEYDELQWQMDLKPNWKWNCSLDFNFLFYSNNKKIFFVNSNSDRIENFNTTFKLQFHDSKPK